MGNHIFLSLLTYFRTLLHTALRQRQEEIAEFQQKLPVTKLRQLFFVQLGLWGIVVVLLFLIFTERIETDYRAT